MTSSPEALHITGRRECRTQQRALPVQVEAQDGITMSLPHHKQSPHIHQSASCCESRGCSLHAWCTLMKSDAKSLYEETDLGICPRRRACWGRLARAASCGERSSSARRQSRWRACRAAGSRARAASPAAAPPACRARTTDHLAALHSHDCIKEALIWAQEEHQNTLCKAGTDDTDKGKHSRGARYNHAGMP